MKSKLVAMAFAFVLASGGSAKAETVSCEIVSGGVRTCMDTSWSGGNFKKAGAVQACSKKGGTPGSGCAHAGSAGGCRHTMSGKGVKMTTTVWYYGTSAAAAMASCSDARGTFVEP